MSFKVVTLAELRELGREHPEKAIESDPDHPLIGLITNITLHAMSKHLTDEAAMTAGLNHLTEEEGWTFVSMTATEAIFRKE